MLFQQLVNRMCLHCLFPTCWQLAKRLLSSTDLLQAVPTTCYRPAIQQFVNKLWVTTLYQLDKITALLQLVDKLATSLLRTHLVDKLWDFYVCTQSHKLSSWMMAVLPHLYTEESDKIFFFAHVCPDGSSVKMNFARTSVWMGQAACHMVAVFV
jgi:hypothetical protein